MRNKCNKNNKFNRNNKDNKRNILYAVDLFFDFSNNFLNNNTNIKSLNKSNISINEIEIKDIVNQYYGGIIYILDKEIHNTITYSSKEISDIELDKELLLKDTGFEKHIVYYTTSKESAENYLNDKMKSLEDAIIKEFKRNTVMLNAINNYKNKYKQRNI